jgi:hypothetical protein
MLSMKTHLVIAGTAILSLAASGVLAADFDCRGEKASNFAVCQSNPALVATYRSALLASADGALKDGLRQAFASITLSEDEQAARIRLLVEAGSLSPRNLAVIPASDTD